MDPDLLDADFVAWKGLQSVSEADGSLKQAATPANPPSKTSSTTPQKLLHEQVLLQLREVKDPDIGRDIVALGFVSDLEVQGGETNEGTVKLCLRLTTPACPFKAQIQHEAEAAVRKLPWVKQVEVVLDSVRDYHAASTERPANLKRVGFIVGVASCKGGSGKSTVCLALALMLRRSGAKVGLLDADIYGPSLPTLLQMEDARVRFATEEDVESDDGRDVDSFRLSSKRDKRGRVAGRRLRIEFEEPSQQGTGKASSKKAFPDADVEMSMLPMVASGIKCMSYGFIAKENEQGYSALRGPFVSSIVEQLLTGTRWGTLDYLLIDLPPGTGDIHITLTQQQVPLDGCIVVTTPQRLSLVDAEKGIKMLNSLSIPTLSVVCNMAYFVCESCNKRHELFGPPEATQQLAELSAACHLLLLPFDARLNAPDFAGSPLPDSRDSFVDRSDPDEPVWQQLHTLADRVIRELSTLRFGSLKPQVSTTPDGSAMILALLRPTGALMGEAAPVMVKEVFEVPGEVLRRRCRCAECLSRQLEGAPLRVAESESIIVELTERQEGGLDICWAGGHESRFSDADLVSVCRQVRVATAGEGAYYHTSKLQLKLQKGFALVEARR
ncbi:hypothetical protein Emag_001228 [Eimeria magna]